VDGERREWGEESAASLHQTVCHSQFGLPAVVSHYKHPVDATFPHIARGCRPANVTPALSRIVHKCRNLPLFSRRPSIGHWKLEHQDHKFTTCISVTDTAQGNIKEWKHTNKSKSTNGHTKHKPRLNTQTKYCSTVTRPARSRLATFGTCLISSMERTECNKCSIYVEW